MITVKRAKEMISFHAKDAHVEFCDFRDSYGRTLAEDIKADRDLPPFHRAAMDGIAISMSAWDSGRRHFHVLGTQAAGVPEVKIDSDKDCWEIMTGAVLPRGCDCVIPIECLDIKDDVARVIEDVQLTKMSNVHKKASDYSQGAKLISRGEKIEAHHMSVIASVGKSKVFVYKIPKIAIIATGDELVAVDAVVASYQIRMSNTYAIECGLHNYGFTNTEIFHLKDDKKQLYDHIKSILEDYDLLVLSGGVSKGKYDYVPEVLQSLDVNLMFRRVQQRPGKPFTFGIHTPTSKVVFAIPGNPVTATTCFRHYLIPYLQETYNMDQKYFLATLDEDFTFSKNLTYFLPVRLKHAMQATPCPTGGSGDYASLITTDGYVELEASQNHFPRGSKLRFHFW